jgi:hypothetical protein
MIMWLSRPLYESLPYNYIAVGLMTLAGSFYLSYWYWPVISAVIGLASLVAGLVVWLKRRGYRHSRSRQAMIDAPQRSKTS